MAAAFLLGAWPAGAESAIQVSVDCTVGGMKTQYGDKLPRILDQLRFLLVQDLQGTQELPPKWPDLAYWKFAQGSSPTPLMQSKEAAAPQLKLSVLRLKAGPVTVKMEYSSPLEPNAGRSWGAEWMARGMAGAYGYPNEDDVVGILREFIQTSVITPNLELLRQSLVASAPLAEGGTWNPKADPRVVLPLPWERYGRLSQGEFRLACTWGAKASTPKNSQGQGLGSGELEILSCGTGEHGTYKGVPPYEAVAVAPKAWRSSRWENRKPLAEIRADGRRLQLLRTYLDEDKWNLCSSQGMEIIHGMEVNP